MGKSITSKASLTTIAIALLACTGTPAFAERADDQAPVDQGDQKIEEIVVTAQHRTESLQKSSVDLDVLSSRDLDRAGISSPDDLTRIAPTLTIGTAAVSPQIYVRGVGDFAATQVNNPAIAVNVDGVYVARTASLSTQMYDLERVEVLKGPQGTLYGRNASGGAVNLITRGPRLGVFEGDASVEIGNLNALNLTAAINIPISSDLAVRIAGNHVRRDGYTSVGRGDAQTDGARVRVLWEPSSSVSLTVNGSYGHVGGRGPGSVIINGPQGLDPYTDNTSPAGIAYVDSKVYVGSGVDLRPLVTSPNSDDAFTDMTFWTASAKLVANLGFADLTIIPSYQNMSASSFAYPFLKVGFGAGFGSFPAKPETSDAYTLEVRLSRDTDHLKWVVGGYFYDETQHLQYTANAGLLQNTGRLANFATRAYAVFGQTTVSLTDTLRLIGGLRYTTDRREMTDGATYFLNPSYLGLIPLDPTQPVGPTNPLVPNIFASPDPNATILAETYSGKKTFNNTSWKVGVEFDAAPEVMLFATASSGFKAGGFNTQQKLGAPAGSDEASYFEPEKLYSYDFGFRSRMFGDHLQVNGGIYYWNYKNQQFNLFAIGNRGNLSVIFANAQKSRMYGAYIDVEAHPWRNGAFNFSVEYDNAKYLQFTYQTAQLLPGATGCVAAPAQPVVIGPSGPIMAVDCTGKPVPRAPRWAGAAGYTHTLDLATGGSVALHGDMTFASARELTTDFIAASRVGGYALFNANVSYTSPDGHFSLMAFVRNITDQALYNDGAEPNYAPGVVIGSIGLPRTYGARLSVKF